MDTFAFPPHRQTRTSFSTKTNTDEMSPAESSPHVEIWRSLPAWDTLAPDRQHEIQSRLEEIVQKSGAGPLADRGPFLRRGRSASVLIWQVRHQDRQKSLELYAGLGLAVYFERIIYGDSPQLSAREIADRFQARRDSP